MGVDFSSVYVIEPGSLRAIKRASTYLKGRTAIATVVELHRSALVSNDPDIASSIEQAMAAKDKVMSSGRMENIDTPVGDRVPSFVLFVGEVGRDDRYCLSLVQFQREGNSDEEKGYEGDSDDASDTEVGADEMDTTL